jgi:hypothetical protein
MMLTGQQLLLLASLLILLVQRVVYGCSQSSEPQCQAMAKKKGRQIDGKQQSVDAKSEWLGIGF